MAPNPNNKSIDEILKELDEIFKLDYSKKGNTSYEEIISKIEKYKKVHEYQNLLIAVQNQIDSRETFLNLELTIWPPLFTCINLLITINNCYNKSSSVLQNIDSIVLIISSLILIISYCIYVKKFAPPLFRKKCFYKMVYNILKSEK